MPKATNIFLVGPMGAGKTSIGKQLAQELGLEFYDSDLAVEERTGVDIAWIFDEEGEEGFRRRERTVISELTQEEGIVLATGGGAVIDPENRNNLAARGIVVYLRTSVDQQLKRTERDRTRPLLQQKNPEKILRDLSIEREPLYTELADFVFDTNGRSVRHVVIDIIKNLENPILPE